MYAKVRVENVYPGIDLVYYGKEGRLEYDFVVKPGGDPKTIRLALSSPAKIDDKGDLLAETSGGEVRWHKPAMYQPASAEGRSAREKTLVAGNYTINEQKAVGFAVEGYDRTKVLVIDPILMYSTYLGGSQQEQGYGIAVDSSGNSYVAGYTISRDFPTVNAFQATNHSAFPLGANAFVTKFNADGSALVYSTYLGGSAIDFAFAIAVDGSGNAYVTGQTDSSDFPTVNAVQAIYAGAQDSFVTKFNADGSALVYSTYIGGIGNDEAYGIAVDNSGSGYVTGWTDSANFPITLGAFQVINRAVASNGSNAFVTKFNPSGSALAYSTYLGGSHFDKATGIAVDGSGDAYVTGGVSSTDFPVVNAFQSSNQDAPFGSAFVTEFNPEGSTLVYSTYLGGSPHSFQGFLVGGTTGSGIAVDGSGEAYVTGWTADTDFPTTPAAFQAASHANPAGSTNSFVAKFNPGGSALVYSSYLGGSGFDQANGIAIAGGKAFVTGWTSDSDFPTASPIQESNHANNNGGRNVFVTEFNPGGSGLVYSTYLGGSTNDEGKGIAVDGSGNAYVTGNARSTDFPTNRAFQGTKNNQSLTAFVAKIGSSSDLSINSTAPSSVASGSTLTYTITVTDNGPDSASAVNIETGVPARTTFNSVSVSAGSCTTPGPGGRGTVVCSAFSLASGGRITETLTVNVTGTPGKTVRDAVSVSSATSDPTSGNNEAAAATTITGTGASLRIEDTLRLFVTTLGL